MSGRDGAESLAAIAWTEWNRSRGIGGMNQRNTQPHEDGTSRLVYTHLVKTFVKALGSCQVLVVREKFDQPLKKVRSKPRN